MYLLSVLNQTIKQIMTTVQQKISPKECGEHDFQFVDFLGSFCTKCDIAFGVECLDPNCKDHYCSRHNLDCEVFTKQNYGDVADMMTNDTKFLHLGHDGVGANCEKDIQGLRRMLGFPNLKRVDYCGYYSRDYFYDIIKENCYNHIEFVPIL